jgi:hypothetical protein
MLPISSSRVGNHAPLPMDFVGVPEQGVRARIRPELEHALRKLDLQSL